MNQSQLFNRFKAICSASDLKFEYLKSIIETIDGPTQCGSWSIGISGRAGFSQIEISCTSAKKEYSSFLERATAALRLSIPIRQYRHLPKNIPWLTLRWDLLQDRLILVRCHTGTVRLRVSFSSGKEEHWCTSLYQSSFSPSHFGNPILSNALFRFSELCSVQNMITEFTNLSDSIPDEPSGRWILCLQEGTTAVDFLRCDIASRFRFFAADIICALGNAAVHAIEFDGDILWAHFGSN